MIPINFLLTNIKKEKKETKTKINAKKKKKTEIKNYFIKETDQNELMSNNHKKTCPSLKYIEGFLILASVVTGCISISEFVPLGGISIGITSSAVG